MKYKWLVKEYERIADAQEVAKELKRVYVATGHLDTPEIVAASLRPGSALQPLFGPKYMRIYPEYIRHRSARDLHKQATSILCALVEKSGKSAFVRCESGFKPAHYNKKIASIIKAMLKFGDDV